MEKYLVIFFASISATLLQVGTAWAEQPILFEFYHTHSFLMDFVL